MNAINFLDGLQETRKRNLYFYVTPWHLPRNAHPVTVGIETYL